MSSASTRSPRLLWLLPMAAALAALGWETDWGRHPWPEHDRASPPAASAPAVALLPEFRLDGGLPARAETVARTLFNPTRRPAPERAPDTATANMLRGQFMLTGTSMDGSTRIAFLREVAVGRSWIVKPGDSVKGLVVADVAPDRVRLALGGESEDLTLKAARATAKPSGPQPPPDVPPTAVLPAAPRAAPQALPGEQQAIPPGIPQAVLGVPHGAPDVPPQQVTPELIPSQRAPGVPSGAPSGAPPTVVDPPFPAAGSAAAGS